MINREPHGISFRLKEFSQLFSASAVIETRAATYLGENIRLLAYVSIFYLPLAFCTVSSAYLLPLLSYQSGLNGF